MASFSPIDRQHLYGQVQQKLREAIESTQTQLSFTRDEAIAAPGRMESRYDSTKQEASYHASALIARLDELKKRLAAIGQDQPMPAGRAIVQIGSLVAIERAGRTSHVFVVAAGEGEELHSDALDAPITAISPQSPIGSLLVGRMKGQACDFRGETITISDIF